MWQGHHWTLGGGDVAASDTKGPHFYHFSNHHWAEYILVLLDGERITEGGEKRNQVDVDMYTKHTDMF